MAQDADRRGARARTWTHPMGTRTTRPAPLRAPDQYPREKDQHADDHDLKRGLQERRIHKAVTDRGDGDELDRGHGDGAGGRGPEIGDEIGERLAEPGYR